MSDKEYKPDEPRRYPDAIPEIYAGIYSRWALIAHLVRTYGWTRGAELGVRKGKTYLYLLEHCPGLSLVGVDLWEEQPENPGPCKFLFNNRDWSHKRAEEYVREKAAAYGHRSILFKGRTSEACEHIPDGSLDFVFIDADHATAAVLADIKNWRPKLRESGLMLGHDINWPEVRAAVEIMYPGYKVGPANCWLGIK
jgi:hypothetical protein